MYAHVGDDREANAPWKQDIGKIHWVQGGCAVIGPGEYAIVANARLDNPVGQETL